jgi:hypothetical protein
MNYSEYLKDKDVVLFGGAKSAKAPEHLENPIVVRTNNHHLWQEPEHYPYTNIVYFGSNLGGLIATFMNEYPKELAWINQVFGSIIRSSFRTWANFKQVQYRELKLEGEYPEIHDYVEAPFTGVLAAWDLVRQPIKSLYITGFDFYKDAPQTIVNGYRGEHGIDGNLKAIREVCADARVQPDGVLQDYV